MEIKIKNKQTFFYDEYSRAKIVYNDTNIEIELIYVNKYHRKQGLGKELLQLILNYIKNRYQNITKVILSPLPIDQDSHVNLNQLIQFYSKHNFVFSKKPPKHSPYQMELFFNL